MERWIERVNWSIIWPGSHVVSGVPAALAMTGGGTDEFFEWYFDWLDRSPPDPASGFWCRGIVHRLGKIPRPTKHEMGGAFHMYYVYEYFGRKWRYPERIVDHTLRLQHANGLWDSDVTYCIDLDGVYCLTRSSRNAGWYRKDDVYRACLRYLENRRKDPERPRVRVRALSQFAYTDGRPRRRRGVRSVFPGKGTHRAAVAAIARYGMLYLKSP